MEDLLHGGHINILKQRNLEWAEHGYIFFFSYRSWVGKERLEDIEDMQRF